MKGFGAGLRRAGGWRSHIPSVVKGTCLLAGALVAIWAVSGCNDYGNTFQGNTGATLISISPADIGAGSPDFTLTMNGSGFVAQTKVQWNQKNIPTTVTTDSSGNVLSVTATVSASLVAKPGTAFVNTLNPFSGAGNNGLSNPIAFIINPPANPVPAISSLSPNSAAAGSASFTLTIAGSNFLPTSGGSQVNWNLGATQSTLPIVNITATQIQATVDSSLLVNSTSQAVTATVTVYNPPAASSGGGGGTSPNGLPFSVTPAGSSPMTASAVEETPAVSVDGRYVAYAATQSDHTQIFVRDTCEGAASGCEPRTLLVSAASDGTAANDDSRAPSITSDGRYIAFSSAATNLATGAPVGRQIYLRDTCFGVTSGCTPSTQLISTDSAGALVGTESILPSISGSGRFVAFLAVTPSHSNAPASKTGATSGAAAQQKPSAAATNSGYRQVFVRDTCLGASNCTPKTTRISMQPGDASNSETKPAGPALSGNSQHVALSGSNTSTLFTHSVAVDDRVFLALTGNQQ
jgi:WD40-like Beta Propeller Repeat